MQNSTDPTELITGSSMDLAHHAPILLILFRNLKILYRVSLLLLLSTGQQTEHVHERCTSSVLLITRLMQQSASRIAFRYEAFLRQ